ncbi:MAG: 2-oxoadipate dioxygenase/decarboxylase HglS [Pseudomonadales bacterium]
MNQYSFIDADAIRADFSAAMSHMYREEVPAYGALIDLVSSGNTRQLEADNVLKDHLSQVENLETLSDQRHGAIRIGKASELTMMRRIFALLGMYPVGYYDLSVAGVPVHSTAFRPVDTESIRNNPFRVFCSLLRLELIKDEQLREKARAVLEARDIFGDKVRELVALGEEQGGFDAEQANAFVAAILEVFRWHQHAAIDSELYNELLNEHPLIADVVSFKGPHINHLTPRTLDIDWVQGQIHTTGGVPKAVIEGPPKRDCPILLRQTAFLAIKEPVVFASANESETQGAHAARFGEIEQRGCALKPKGRALYDQLLNEARGITRPLNDGSNLAQYLEQMQQVFSAFPDEYAAIREQQLGYFSYSVADASKAQGIDTGNIEALVAAGAVRFDPITYEDFLPVSAAGIFQSNLGQQGEKDFVQEPNQAAFERDLEASVADEFALYQQMEQRSIDSVKAQLHA